MNILILGGHGFIGHHVAQQFNSQGHRVSVVDCHHRYGDYAIWEYQPVLSQRLNYMGPHTFYQGDVTDAEFMATVILPTFVYENALPIDALDSCTPLT